MIYNIFIIHGKLFYVDKLQCVNILYIPFENEKLNSFVHIIP
jgi:hypothetical protein